MDGHRFPPTGAVGLAVLAAPADGAAQDDAQDHDGVGGHHTGGQQHRDEGFQQRSGDEREGAAEGAANARHENRAGDGENLRQEEQAEDERAEDQALGHAVDLEQAVDQGAVVGEVAQVAGGAVPGDPGSEDEEEEPQRAAEIGHDAHEQMGAHGQRQLAGEDQPEVLEVALAPAAVALEVVDQGRRGFLVGALDVPCEPDFPALADHQRGFDEVMAEDFPAEGFAAGKVGKLAEIRERLHADQRVVAPVAAAAELPPVEAADEERAVEPHRELLEAGEDRRAADQLGRGLEDAQVRVGLHHAGHLEDVATVHQAVGVEHHHALVAAAPGADEVADVAGLAVLVLFTASVVDPAEAAEFAAEVGPGGFLQHPEVEVAGVAEDEKVVGLEMAGGFDRAVDRLDAGAEAVAVLVVNGHHHGVAAGEGSIARLLGELRDADRALPPPQDVPGPEQGVEGAEHQQAVEDEEDDQQQDVGAVHADPREQVVEPVGRHEIDHDDPAEEYQPSQGGAQRAEEGPDLLGGMG